MDKNLNDTLDNCNNLNLKHDFNFAVRLVEDEISYEKLIDFLINGSDVQKQFAVLELPEIRSTEDALALTSNLVGQNGKIREAVAFKLNEFVKNSEYSQFFIGEDFFDLFLQGIMDINGNVCRMLVELTLLPEFKKFLAQKLPSCIENSLNDIKNLSKDEKQYKISKRNFQLYWLLEALYNAIDLMQADDLKPLLCQTANFEDYTIREKTAKILTKTNSDGFSDLKKQLQTDSNYYVRRYLKK